jgi:DNA-binding NtrC family response regulator
MSRILVVDDKELMRDSVATTLVRKDHTVVTANAPKSALEKLADRPFDLVITDLQMPEMDGVQLLGEIRRHDEQLPVILMTAFGTVESAVAAMTQKYPANIVAEKWYRKINGPVLSFMSFMSSGQLSLHTTLNVNSMALNKWS